METEICKQVIDLVRQNAASGNADFVGQVINLFALAIIGMYLRDIRRRTNGG